MKSACALLLALLSSCGIVNNLRVYGGAKAFTDDELSDVDDQGYVALEWVGGGFPFGIDIEAGVGQSGKEADSGGGSLDSETLELYVGVRKTFRTDKMLRPYIAGGLSYLDTELELSGSGGGDFIGADSTEALYVRGGVGWHFTLCTIGVDVRYNALGEAEVENLDIDLDHGLISFFVGLSF